MAAYIIIIKWLILKVSTHSHPKVAAIAKDHDLKLKFVSTHSHPKVAATIFSIRSLIVVSFNTQPPEGGCGVWTPDAYANKSFQHTATRRWLRLSSRGTYQRNCVSTHSHPKVAADCGQAEQNPANCFNTQPPEGGCTGLFRICWIAGKVSTHSHPKVAAPTMWSR